MASQAQSDRDLDMDPNTEPSSQPIDQPTATETDVSAEDKNARSPPAAGTLLPPSNQPNGAIMINNEDNEIRDTTNNVGSSESTGIEDLNHNVDFELKLDDTQVHDMVDLTWSEDEAEPKDISPCTSQPQIIKDEPQEFAAGVFGAQMKSRDGLQQYGFNARDNRHCDLEESSAPGGVQGEDLGWMLQAYLRNQEKLKEHDGQTTGKIMAIDSDEEEVRQAEAFQQLQKRYEAKEQAGELDMEEEVEFARAKEAESRRQSALQKKRAYQEDEDRMFFSENEDPDMPNMPSAPAYAEVACQAKKKARLQRGETTSDDDVEPARPKSRRGRGGGAAGNSRRSTASKAVAKSKSTKSSSTRGRGRRRRGDSSEGRLNIASLAHNDIIGDALRNQGKEAQPTLKSRNRKQALNQLMASIPLGSGHRNPHHREKNDLDEACSKFSHRGPGSMYADPTTGGWRLKGMKTSLYHYQLLGVGFMRDRETGNSPYGGILADSMGYGKTVMALANIVEGKPKPGAKNETTLIVCPSSMCKQWYSEVQAHIEKKVFRNVMIYRAGSRVESVDQVETLKSYDIVITTYHEVMQHYPRAEAPSHLVQEESKAKWWANYYEENKGPFLRVAWHRVILDEGHLIKNHEARTSIACRTLCAKYRWVISGTPLQNGVEDLAGYFLFLRVPGAGDHAAFLKNYCKKNETTYNRLNSLLQAIMVRRTGSDTLFGRPILSLPALNHETVHIDFDETEREIYDIVRRRFIKKVNSWYAGGSLHKQARSILEMLTRLRQMCAHVLMVLPCLIDLLEMEDVEKLWELTDKETQPQDANADPGTIKILRWTLVNTNTNAEPTDETDGDLPASPTQTTEFEPNTLTGIGAKDGGFKFRKHLRKLLEDGTWDDIVRRSLCRRCHERPQNPRLTVCYHLYCVECLTAMHIEARSRKEDAPRCTGDCGHKIKGSRKLRAPTEVARNSEDRAGCNSRTSSTDSDECDISWINAPEAPLLSAKVQAVKSTIKEWMRKDRKCKIIIFSLFLPTLEVLQEVADREGWGWIEYVGKMDARARDKAIEKYKKDPRKRIMFASMKTGGLGLNLTMASKCCIIDPWWNQSVEDQSFSRIFRIGQQKDVEVRRFVIRDTVDTELLHRLQDKKNKEIDRVMGSGRLPQNWTIKDVMKLFGPLEKDPNTGQPIVEEDEDVNEFVIAEDELVQDDSDADVPDVVPPRPF